MSILAIFLFYITYTNKDVWWGVSPLKDVLRKAKQNWFAGIIGIAMIFVFDSMEKQDGFETISWFFEIEKMPLIAYVSLTAAEVVYVIYDYIRKFFR